MVGVAENTLHVPQACLYLVNTLVTRVLWPRPRERPPASSERQGALIVSNHRSSIDPLLIHCDGSRGPLARRAGIRDAPGHGLGLSHPPEHSRESWRGGHSRHQAAIRLLKRGGLVGLFPEGRINLTEKLLLPGRPGAALIALKARVPGDPCYVVAHLTTARRWAAF